ncbi:phosphate ABC transporter, permease protein PstA, partial [Fusobacterium necrophorum]
MKILSEKRVKWIEIGISIMGHLSIMPIFIILLYI